MIHALTRFFRKRRKLVIVLFLVFLSHLLLGRYSSFYQSIMMIPRYITIVSPKMVLPWPGCTDYIKNKETLSSFGGKYVAYLSSRCCTGENGYCIVTIELKDTDFFSIKHPIFIFNIRRGCFKTEATAFTWLSENELEIEDVHVGRIELQQHEVEGVKIKYKINAFDSSPPESLARVGIVSYPDKYADIDFDKAKREIADLAGSGQISQDLQRAMLVDLSGFQDTLCWRERSTMDRVKEGK